jgi:hypothetical protein
MSADHILLCTSISDLAAVAAFLVLCWQALSCSALQQSVKTLAISVPVSGPFWVCLGLHYLSMTVDAISACTFWPYIATFQNFPQTSQLEAHHGHNLHTSKLV